MRDTYHHGDLRVQVLVAAADLIAVVGPDALSLRELARRAGVSHAAPAYHFGDRRGLFTAVAAQGFALLSDALAPSIAAEAFDQTAVAYVDFALTHRGHFAVMFRSDLLGQSAELTVSRTAAAELLDIGARAIPASALGTPVATARAAAWSLVHGVATLTLAGALGDTDPRALAMEAAHQLFRVD